MSDDSVQNPVVFNCSKCNTIIGDSFSLVAMNETVKTITLMAASNVEITAQLFTSRIGFDEGCTYFCLSCYNCQSVLGKYYVTSSEDLDSLREKFTFNSDQIRSYELGVAEHGMPLIKREIDVIPSLACNESSTPNKLNDNEIIKVKLFPFILFYFL
jgi:hypothetical protein